MDDVKNQLAARLKQANNVLVTVTSNPSVDQLAAAIGLTLVLNKLNKHATAVFSGAVPETINFLSPEKTIETNTDSLRDFIISLDKSKADKLRYKIEDNFVKIFITPYHASISDKDLVFSQGDFNVDVVVALGVHKREELDQAITSHGRILHDATVASVNTAQPSNLGSLNWSDNKSSSLCEMLVVLCGLLGDDKLFDAQIANALLTGIVAETQRFSNQKTTSLTMSTSSKLLAAGANQQLVAKELTPKTPPPPPPAPPEPKHEDKAKQEDSKPVSLPPVQEEPEPKQNNGELKINHGDPNLDIEEPSDVTQVLIDEQGTLKTVEQDKKPPVDSDSQPKPPEPPAPPQPVASTEKPVNSTPTEVQGGSRFVTEPPAMAGELNANEHGSGEQDSYTDPLSTTAQSKEAEQQPLLTHNSKPTNEALPNLNDVRSAVDAALANNPNPISNQPLQSLNAQPVNLDLNNQAAPNPDNPDAPQAPPVPPPLVTPPELNDNSLPPSMTAL